MSDNETPDSELERLQRDLLVFLTHRIAEMGVDGQAPAVGLNKAIVEAIVQQNREAAREAASEVERQTRAGMADLVARLERIEQSLTAARMEPASLPAPEGGKPGAHRSGARAFAERSDREQGHAAAPDETGQADAGRAGDSGLAGDGDAPEADDGQPESGSAKGWKAGRMAGLQPVILAAAMLIPAGGLGLAWYAAWQDKIAAMDQQKAMAQEQLGFCEMANEAIRALGKPAEAPAGATTAQDRQADATAGTTPAQSPEQERLASAAAELCGKDN